MIIVLVFLAAFLFMIADSKISKAANAGMALIFLEFVPLTILFRYRFLTGMKSKTLFYINGIPGIVTTDVFFTVLFYIVSAGCIYLALNKLGEFVGRLLFDPDKDGGNYRKSARALYIIASCISGFVGLYLIFYGASLRIFLMGFNPAMRKIERIMGRARFQPVATILLGSAFVILCLIFLIPVSRKRIIYKELMDSTHATMQTSSDGSQPPSVFNFGMIFSIIGVAGTWIIAAVGLIIWRKIYFYNGYGYTKVLCTIALILMAAGSICLITGLVAMSKRKETGFSKNRIIVSIILISFCVVDSAMLISNAVHSLFR